MRLLVPLLVALTLAGCASFGAHRQYTDADFARVQTGMTREEIRRQMGTPYDTWLFARLGTEAWDYLHTDPWGYSALFSVIFGADGKVTGTLVLRVNDGGDYGQ